MINVLPGDLLFYRKNPNLFNRLVDVAEEVENGRQKYEFYHCSIALNQWEKVEADGRRVNVNPIEPDGYSVFRPPINQQSINYALFEIRKYIGQRYDWTLIADDALRYLTHNHIHFPVNYIRSTERHAKVCSSLVARYFFYAGWSSFYGFNESPEDIWLAVKDYEVTGVSM